MIFAITLLVFFGFYCLYNTSKRAKLNRTGLNLWLQTHAKFSKMAGVAMILLAHILCCLEYGIGAGVFVALVLWMTLGSLIIILTPLINKNSDNASES